MNQTKICLVRHGETPWNAEKRIQGQTDIALNSVGEAQAAATARSLFRQSIEALYSSDLLRAQQTARCISATINRPAELLPALRERRYGNFEGLTYTEANQRYPDAYRRFAARDADFALPGGGESLCQLHARVVDALQMIAARHAGQTVVLVTHGGVLDSVNRFVRGNALSLPRDFLIPNAAVNWLSVDGEHWGLLSWGETSHLQATGLDELA